MYKVFFNDHQLLLGAERDNSFNDNIFQCIEIKGVGDLFDLLEKLEKMKHVVKLIIVSAQGDDLIQLIRENMTEISAAGGIVRNTNEQLLFIKRMGKWDLPKGKIKADETVERAAVREVEEECGISGVRISKSLPATYHVYRSPFIKQKNNWVFKKTHWFEMEYLGNESLTPQVEEQIEEVRWFKPEELSEVYRNTYANMKQLLKAYLD